MKRIVFLIYTFTAILVNAQEYSFIPDSLRLLSQAELMQNPPPSNVELVYYEDGTKTTFQKVLPLIMEQKLQPYMFVDKEGNYIALVAAKLQTKPEDIRIEYKNMPDSLQRLGYSFGNPNSDTIIINTQGGPMINLLTDNFKSIFKDAGGIDEEKYLVVNVHQFQTLNPEKFKKEEISFEQAKAYSKKTSKVLYNLTNFFKSENKKVFIVGISFGAFTGASFIAEYGNIADGHLFMVGRLDMPEGIWKAFSGGINADFKEDAVTVKMGNKSGDVTAINLRKIAAGFGHSRYSKLLQDIDLSNLTYFYAKNDQSVGKLTDDEIDFLKSKDANVISFDGTHGNWPGHLKEGLELLLNN